MDMVYIGAFVAFLLVTFALLRGCARLERKK